MPPRLSAHDFDQELLIWFDAYVHGQLDRRGFLERAQKFAVGGTTALGLLAALSPDFAHAQVAADDPRLRSGRVSFASPQGNGQGQAYWVKPAQAGDQALPAVLVIHENRGLNPHIEDVARRFALQGYLAFAPDALHPLGGYPGNEDRAREAFARLDQATTREDFAAALSALQSRSDVRAQSVAAVGFCWGGGMVHHLSLRGSLAAGVPFYGNLPPASEAARVRCPLQLHFADVDERINAAWPGYEAALQAAKANFEAHRYANTQHGFHNDTTPRFDPGAAALAWQRTLSFLTKHLARS